MLRYLAGVVSALLLVGAGVVLFRSEASSEAPALPAPRALVGQEPAVEAAADSAPLPAAAPRTREQRRFGRYDKDKDGIVARDEYLASRRKAYAKLDANGDGRLSFDEWSVRTADKFAKADRNRDGRLDATEFATTAVVRRARPRLPCVPQPAED